MHLICFIGLRSAGKTTLAKAVAHLMGFEHFNLDHYMHTVVLKEEGGINAFVEKHKDDGGWGWRSYHKKIQELLPHLLHEFQKRDKNVILDLGGGVVISENADIARANRKTLKPYAKYLLLLPSKNKEKSIMILAAREKVREHGHFKDWTDEKMREKTLTDWDGRVPPMKRLADWIVYAEDDSIDVLAHKIQRLLANELKLS